jgi:hypothetical protein
LRKIGEGGGGDAGLRTHTQAINEDLPFAVVRSNGTDERAMNLLIACGAYREAVRVYPDNLIELWPGRARDREEPIDTQTTENSKT